MLNIKKLITTVVAFAMIFCIGTNVLATEQTTTSTKKDTVESVKTENYATKDVEVKVRTEDTTTVYSVDIEWDDLTFTYDYGQTGTWNPETHLITAAAANSDAKWDKTTANIKVTNHSNAAVSVEAMFIKTNEDNTTSKSDSAVLNEVTAALSTNSFDLDAGVLGNYDGAAYNTAKVAISGTPTAPDFTLGTITVTVTTKSDSTQTSPDGNPDND